MAESKEYTEEEVRELFLKRVWILIDYWKVESYANVALTIPDMLEGLAFSILSELDGEGIDLPGFAVIPNPNQGDKFFFMDREENYFPDFDYEDEVCDIGGSLHELFHTVGRMPR